MAEKVIGIKSEHIVKAMRGSKIGSLDLSPFDIPDKASICYDSDGRRYEVVFDYLTNGEHKKPEKFAGGLTVWRGSKTGKLYKLEARDVSPGSVRGVKLGAVNVIEMLIERIPNSLPRQLERLNLRLAKTLFEEENEFYEGLIPC